MKPPAAPISAPAESPTAVLLPKPEQVEKLYKAATVAAALLLLASAVAA